MGLNVLLCHLEDSYEGQCKECPLYESEKAYVKSAVLRNWKL
jgi:hypothetical protein